MTHHFAYPRVTEIRGGQARRTTRHPADDARRRAQRDLVRLSLLCVPDAPDDSGR